MNKRIYKRALISNQEVLVKGDIVKRTLMAILRVNEPAKILRLYHVVVPGDKSESERTERRLDLEVIEGKHKGLQVQDHAYCYTRIAGKRDPEQLINDVFLA